MRIFTGIVEELGTVNKVEKGSRSCKLTVGASLVLSDVKLGDSIAINGVCLTVVEYTKNYFSADVMAETLDRTSLKHLHTGSRVNLERAVRLGDRMGGHLVQGHVDAVGTIMEQQKLDIATIFKIKAPPEVIKYTVPKGSIAIDGISLTVVDVWPEALTVSIIPHTAQLTTLGIKKPGEIVNLESDIIGRYVEKLIKEGGHNTNIKLDRGFLTENGFI